MADALKAKIAKWYLEYKMRQQLASYSSAFDYSGYTKGVSSWFPSSSHDSGNLFKNPRAFFLSTDPLYTAILLCVIIALACLIASWITKTYSHVDKIWSIAPVAYVWHFTILGDYKPRLVLMSLLVTAWALRLTYNFWRKGGYNGEEDYRWPYLRKHTITNPILWQIFNIFFIAFFQNLLLLGITLPAYVVAVSSEDQDTLLVIDLLLAMAFIGFLVMETTADNQQWAFQTVKYALIRQGKQPTGIYQKGFITEGLFQYSRHPNFFAEQAMWWTIYLFGAVSARSLYHATFWAPLILSLLFQGSTGLTEDITRAKYPQYVKYQETTSRLIPWFPYNRGIANVTY